MTKILIVESNSPEVVDHRRARNLPVASTYYEAALRANAEHLSVAVAEPYRTPLSQSDLETADGVVLTGAGVPWSVEATEARVLREAGELVLKAGLPVIGSCNGLQLAALLLGGKVGTCRKGMEIGLARNIRMTPDGRTHPMMATRSDGYCVPCVHRDEVQELPPGATLMAYNDHSQVQAMVYDVNGVDFWGMQYHPEMPISSIADSVSDETSIFMNASSLVSDLRIAETDLDAATRLGGKSEELSEKARTAEIANWLAHVQKAVE
ncbi:gamma-glutamyl-gamma-aminobutyrate hydrolase family protein [Leisingera daeponensis]|uniref:Gamma-glutamyl-gamma-aminobutyrate hydrolase family protein n=1 Tax=Leisingera daeponensis TaxID=405746 RepID=A0ABS7NLW4_9RHOB|nr:gamma-glutamyl-gamma-aminobutyrate hydrolase family protein [Leisingera daeponensis]MBY6142167.1 gamma-glutamyl-gamma-aminobutyrate hydrolase family protein [Leisingera daeponensis]